MSANRADIIQQLVDERGWPVFPCWPGTKDPSTSHGFYDAKTDKTAIQNWWGRNQRNNVAIPTGRVTHTIVIDRDPKHDSETSFPRLVEKLGPLPETLRQQTRSGGTHHVFNYPDGLDVDLRIAAPIDTEYPGIDIRANGGYILIPPSYIPPDNGAGDGHYKWLNSAPIVDLPQPWLEWLIESQRQRKQKSGKSPEAWDAESGAPIYKQGNKHYALVSLAGTMTHRGFTAEAIAQALVEMNRTQCKPPAPEENVRKIAYDVHKRYAAGQPVEEEPDETGLWELSDLGEVEEWKTDPLVWVLKGLIPEKGIGFVSGAPKDGKSFMTLDQVVHIMHKKPWLERHETNDANILYLAREDPKRRLKERALEINESYGYGPLPKNRALFLIRERFSLTDNRHMDWLFEQVRTREFNVVVLDVLNRMTPELNENDPKDMAKMVSVLEKLNRELGLTIVNIDHTRKPVGGKGSERDLQSPNPFDLKGSVAKYGAADFMLCLSRTGTERRLQLYCENKDTDEHPWFFIDVSPEGSGQPKFKYGGDIERMIEDNRAKGRSNRNAIFGALTAEWVSIEDLIKQLRGNYAISNETARKHLVRMFEDGKAERLETTKGKASRWRRKEGATPYPEESEPKEEPF